MTLDDSLTLMRYGLTQDDLQRIRAIFSRFPELALVSLLRRESDNAPLRLSLTAKEGAKDNSQLLYKVIGALEMLDLGYGFDVSLNGDNQIHDDVMEIYSASKNAVIEQEVEKQAHQVEIEEAHGHAPNDDYDPAYTQSEAELEESLISRLTGLGYERVTIRSAEDLRANLKRQLEIHNKVVLTDTEFTAVVNHLNKGNVFARADTLRGRFHLPRENGKDVYLQFLNTDFWCQNEYQVTNQVRQKGGRVNRYDVTLLVNGLPLVQIELKRRGVELKEAFHQINRYQRDTFWSEDGLFNYVQLFVISNGVNTKYFSNNRDLSDYKQTFFWTDEKNNLVTQLDAFADTFLEKCHVSKMICRYMVLHQSSKLLMVLRPYQVYAVENILRKVTHFNPNREDNNGYVWHTTGSGKTLTSYKAAQIMCRLGGKGKVDKVLFVVDRADLDYQTSKEFNHFSEGCVDSTDNTRELVKQLTGDTKLIVTTIQKLNTAVSKGRHETAMQTLQGKRVVLIFDECHRSQFGESHARIKAFFGKTAQLFGFTGTPILSDNHVKYQTTESLFGKHLHKYLITNAIADDNVLKFSVEYWGQLRTSDNTLVDESTLSKADWEKTARIESVVDWIIENHDRKTHQRKFSSMLCVGSKAALIKYYDLFQQKRLAGEHDLRVVTIFSFADNEAEEEDEKEGDVGDPNLEVPADTRVHRVSRDKLASYVQDYNSLYKTSHTIKDSKAFYRYYNDIAKRMKEREKDGFKDADRADVLLVVNMFLTGFDAKKLNTLYVDKNLKNHGLIQAFSRTNRIFGELKSQGNVVCFRNLKDNVDTAIKMYCNPNTSDQVLLEDYAFYVGEFNQGVVDLHRLVASPDEVNSLVSEDAQLAFVRSFRYLMRNINKLKSFTEFDWAQLEMDAQTFSDFSSKYQDLFDRQRQPQDEKVSVLDGVDFELELIQRDEVNVAYILRLLGDIQAEEQAHGPTEATRQQTEEIMKMLGNEVQLRSKRGLIEKFVNEYMPNLAPEQDLNDTFAGFWQQQKRQAVHALCETEHMDKTAFYGLIDEYAFTGKLPLRDQVFALLDYKPKLLERKKVFERIMGEFNDIIETYEENTGLIEGVSEPSVDYDVTTLASLAHSVGDRSLYFSDQLTRSRHTSPIAKFVLHLDTPYTKALESLSHYQLGSELLAHGVVNDDILAQYLSLTARFQSLLAEYDLPFSTLRDEQESGLFWSLSEAREGSTVLEFVLQYWQVFTGVGVGTSIYRFVMDYPKLSDGFKRLKDDIKTFLPEQKEEQASMMIVEEVENELKKLRDNRE
ncbi:type I restriction endonuclease subunit R [Marinomonas sp. RSW2]|uniref:Type I restriction enzyme endonuclease subunit n=1 Tax=Marinomonas maritima TaxID=2940935 RepID=A0ABT5WHP1_9GAMM|nr:type I restriction endonuclease subunit R [Marinomonas maritima]MDE8604330.1 type I restriction endonuclease subunit R [Marinomonas maritima]